MANLDKVVYLSEAQKETLFTNGSITVNGQTIEYSDDDLYVTPSAIDTAPAQGSSNLITSGAVYNAIQNVTYENKIAENGGTDNSLVSTGDKYNWNNATILISQLSESLIDNLNFKYNPKERGLSISGNFTFKEHIYYTAKQAIFNAKNLIDTFFPSRTNIEAIQVLILDEKEKSDYVNNQAVAAVVSSATSGDFCKVFRYRNNVYQAPSYSESYDAILEVNDTMAAISYSNLDWQQAPKSQDTVIQATAATNSVNCKNAIFGDTYDNTNKIMCAQLCNNANNLVENQVVMVFFTGTAKFNEYQDGCLVRWRNNEYQVISPNNSFDGVILENSEYIITELEV